MSVADQTASDTGTETKIISAIVTPELYRQNAFRILKLHVTVTSSDLARVQKRLKIIEKLGVDEASGAEGCLPLVPAPDGEAIRRATQRLCDPEIRIVDELFWLWPLDDDHHDDEGLRGFSTGDWQSARAFWNQKQNDPSLAAAAAHNLAVIYHAKALDHEFANLGKVIEQEPASRLADIWSYAFRRWREVMEQDSFWQHLVVRIRQIDDPRLATGFARRLRQTLPTAILRINCRLLIQAARAGDMVNAKRHLALIQNNGFDESIVNGAIESEIEPLMDQLRSLLEPIQEAVTTQPGRANHITRQLMHDAASILAGIDLILPAGHVLRGYARDRVCETVRDCMITFGNQTEKWDECLAVLRQAIQIRPSTDMTARLAEDVRAVEQNIKQEAASNLQLEIRGKSLSIDRGGVRFGSEFMSADQISGVRWGIFVQYTNGSPSYRSYLVAILSKDGSSIAIECHDTKFFRTENEEQSIARFQAVVDACLLHVVPMIVVPMAEQISAGHTLAVGSCKLDRHGVTFTTGILFWKKAHQIAWRELSVVLHKGVVFVASRRDPRINVGLSMRDDWNAVLMESLSKLFLKQSEAQSSPPSDPPKVGGAPQPSLPRFPTDGVWPEDSYS